MNALRIRLLGRVLSRSRLALPTPARTPVPVACHTAPWIPTAQITSPRWLATSVPVEETTTTEAAEPAVEPSPEELADTYKPMVPTGVDFPTLHATLAEQLKDLVPHRMPTHTQLHLLINVVTTTEEAAQAAEIMAQWHAADLPVTSLATSRFIYQCCKLGCPRFALKILSDRVTYGANPRLKHIHHLMSHYGHRSLVHSQACAANASDDQLRTLFEHAQDDMFRAFALPEFYQLAYDATSYSILIRYCVQAATDESYRRASVAAAEATQFDPPLITEEAAILLRDACKARGEHDKASYLNQVIAKLPQENRSA